MLLYNKLIGPIPDCYPSLSSFTDELCVRSIRNSESNHLYYGINSTEGDL